MFKFLCIPVRDGSGPLLFPPSKIHPGSLPSRTSFPSPLSFLPFCLLSVHISLFGHPPPAASGPSSSVRRKSSALRLTVDQFPLLLSCPAAHNAGVHPPHDLCGWWYLAWVWAEGQKETNKFSLGYMMNPNLSICLSIGPVSESHILLILGWWSSLPRALAI